jgi:D-aminopeptidase
VTRLRDLELDIGRLPPGEQNAITDVEGVSAGHVDIDESGLCTGITAILPYPADVTRRELFLGRWALDGGDAMTSLEVVEDLGTFSSPIVLVPAPAVGKAYGALIQHGLERDPGLSTAAGWPPLVLGVDDGLWNPARTVHDTVVEQHLARALSAAAAGPVLEGNAGIGRGLCAFGMKGGIGTASRLVEEGGTPCRLGALVAANAGKVRELRVDGFPVGPSLRVEAPGDALPSSFAVVVATDAPLLPGQLDRLAGRAALGLVRAGLLDVSTRAGQILAFSTAAAAPEAGGKVLEAARFAGEALLYELFAAAAEASEEALLNALLAAAPVAGRAPSLEALPREGWPEAVRRFQKVRGW